MSTAFGYRCEYCGGIVRPKQVEREAFKHKNGFVILEDIVVGVCDRCGSRYYAATTLRRVHDIASGRATFERTEQVPVARAG